MSDSISMEKECVNVLISGENVAFWFRTVTTLSMSDWSVRSSGVPCDDPPAPVARRRRPVATP